MIAKEAAFHSAIRAGNEQCVVIQMPDTSTFLTNEDIASDGLTYTESVNTETNLTMGRAVESEITMRLLNDGQLQGVRFDGEMRVWLGAKTGDTGVDVSLPSNATLALMTTDGKLVAAHTAWSYVLIDGVRYTLKTTPRLLMMYGNNLYVIGNGGGVIAYYSVHAGKVTALSVPTLTEFMAHKLSGLAAKKVCYRFDGEQRADYTVQGGRLRVCAWSMCPLGVFPASKPEKVRTRTISLTAYDRMSRFEVEAQPFLDSLTFPITMEQMLSGLCRYCGVPLGTTRLLNGSKSFSESPIYDNMMTCRELLAWIAEANCTIARVNRNGALELTWYAESGYTLMRDDIYDIVSAEYSVWQIEKLQVHCSEEDIGVIIPQSDATKTNYYEIMDNPMLYGVEDGEIRPLAEPIYNRLIAFPSYCPMSVDAESDFAVCAGDIIRVEQEDGSKAIFPLMNQTIRWAGGTAKTTMDCTGEKTRGQMTNRQRERLVNGRKTHEFRVTLDDLLSKIESIDTNTVATYAQDEAPPSGKAGDLWIDTNDNKLYRHDGTAWVNVSGESESVKTYAQNKAPSSANAGDLWINTANGNKLYRYNGSGWVPYAQDEGIDTYAQTTAPSGGVKVGDLWIDTDDNNALYRWNGSRWVKVQDTHLDKVVENHTTAISQNTKSISLKADASTVTSLMSRVSSAEEKITADAIVSTVRSSTSYKSDLNNKVGANELISCINQTAEQIKIQASKIALEGIITANGNVKIDSAGNITCKKGTFTDGTFSGTLTAGNWSFTAEGSKYSNGGISANMTVLTGGGFVGGGSYTRVFYGSSGCDVQYGSDYAYQCIIRGGTVSMFTGEGTGICVEHVNGAWDPSLYCIGAGSDWSSARGNLGGASHRWDVGYIRSFNQSSSRHVKHDISDMPDMGDVIDKLRTVTFVYNGDENEETQYGLIFEEAIDVFPHICLPSKTGDVNEIGIDYTKLIPVLLEGVKTLRRRVAALEA